MATITPKQQRFVDEYLIDLNGTQAAIRAGYSERTANEQSSQLLAKLHIRQAVEAAKAKRAEKTEITQDWVLERLIANHDRSVAAEEGSVANKALELIGKHLGMFVERVEQTNRVQVISDKPVSPDEWEARYSKEPGVEPTAGTSESTH